MNFFNQPKKNQKNKLNMKLNKVSDNLVNVCNEILVNRELTSAPQAGQDIGNLPKSKNRVLHFVHFLFAPFSKFSIIIFQ